jgi:hypothetical protein
MTLTLVPDPRTIARKKGGPNHGHFAAVNRSVAGADSAPHQTVGRPDGWDEFDATRRRYATGDYVRDLQANGTLPEYGTKADATAHITDDDEVFALIKEDMRQAFDAGTFPEGAKLKFRKETYGDYQISLECDDPNQEMFEEVDSSPAYGGTEPSPTWEWGVAAKVADALGDAYNKVSPHDHRHSRYTFDARIGYTLGATAERKLRDPRLAISLAGIKDVGRKGFKEANQTVGYPIASATPAQALALAKRLQLEGFPEIKMTADVARFYLVAHITRKFNPELGDAYLAELDRVR